MMRVCACVVLPAPISASIADGIPPFLLILSFFPPYLLSGERSQDPQHLLHEVQQAQHPQGDPVQGWKGFIVRPRYKDFIKKSTFVQGVYVDVGKRRYDRKQRGFGGQTKPVFHKKVC
jgi:hypothetical protein